MSTLAHISDYLLEAEFREPDFWHQQDYRLASVMVGQAEQGDSPDYDWAFVQLFGKWPKDVTWWWRDREKLLFLSEYCNRPTPLLLANYAEELLLGEWVEIPDHGWVPKAAVSRFLILKRQEVRREYMRDWQREHRAESKARAVCIECAAPAAPGSKSRCAKHLEMLRQSVAKHASRRIALGLCRNCTKPVEAPSNHFCAYHRNQQNARKRDYMQRRRLLKQAQKAAAA